MSNVQALIPNNNAEVDERAPLLGSRTLTPTTITARDYAHMPQRRDDDSVVSVGENGPIYGSYKSQHSQGTETGGD